MCTTPKHANLAKLIVAHDTRNTDLPDDYEYQKQLEDHVVYKVVRSTFNTNLTFDSTCKMDRTAFAGKIMPFMSANVSDKFEAFVTKSNALFGTPTVLGSNNDAASIIALFKTPTTGALTILESNTKKFEVSELK